MAKVRLTKREKAKKVYSDKPIGKMVRVNDFLPPSEKLILPQKTRDKIGRMF